MAIQITHTLPSGITCKEAYLKLHGDTRLSGKSIQFSGRIYADKEARDENLVEIGSLSQSIEFDGVIPTNEDERIALLYTELKKLPEYESATNC